MEALRNYLENMFANLPNTPEVQRAKSELFQMMEDKYTSLIEEGKKENEAIGIVISEFGNLNEIADSLGISNVVEHPQGIERRHVSKEEAQQYVVENSHCAFLTGLGVFFCIISPALPSLFEDAVPEQLEDALGGAAFFGSIAIAVALFIYSASKMKNWSFLKRYPCSIDYQTADELYKAQKLNNSTKTLHFIIGVLLCILWLIPVSISDALVESSYLADNVMPCIMFLMVGIGVMLIIFSLGKDKAYTTLLGLNDQKTVAGNYESTKSREVVYSNETIANIMSVYWPTVRCVYLIWSFLTFDWLITWIIWPVAAVIHSLVKKNFREEV